MSELSPPQVYDFMNYREFLAEFAAYKRSYSRGFSFRRFSQRAGISSPNYLQSIISGKRNLGNSMLEKFVKGLQLQEPEARYFRTLVSYNQSKSMDFKTSYLRDLLELQRKRKSAPRWVVNNQVRRKWYTIVIWELVTCKDFVASPENIARALHGEIDAEEARHSLATLVEGGFLEKAGTNHYRQTGALIGSNDEIADSILQQSHQKFIEKSISGLQLPVSEREYQGLTIALSAEGLQTLKKRMKETIKDLAMDYGNDAQAQRVYRINLNAFPLTAALRKETHDSPEST